MKRFVKGYANYQITNNPFYSDSVYSHFYIHRINKAVKMCEKGYLTENNAIKMILNAEQFARQEVEA